MDNSASSHLDAFQVNRPWLFAIAYRMLGSASEADDVLQDAFLRFQGVALDEIEFPKAYLSTIVTRLCLNRADLRQEPARDLPGSLAARAGAQRRAS